eukprot:12822561-Heterocapsa_arctica.AAC.1
MALRARKFIEKAPEFHGVASPQGSHIPAAPGGSGKPGQHRAAQGSLDSPSAGEHLAILDAGTRDATELAGD